MPRSGRSEVLTPALPTRLLLTAVYGAFLAGGAVFLSGVVSGETAWTTTVKIGVPLVVLVVVGCLVGLVAVWTNRVWVDHDRNELHQFVVLRTAKRTLDPPGTVRLSYTPTAIGSTVSPTWKVLFSEPGQPTMSVSTPWVTDIADVLRILQPALERNPDLPEDDYTREAIEHPDRLRRPHEAGPGA